MQGLEGMDKNMSAMRAEMDAVPKRFDAVETNLGRKISESEAATRRYTGKTVFPGGRRQKRNVLYVHLGWKDKRSAENTNIPADLTIRITQVQAYRRPQNGSRI